jgi:hypothetical protein
MSLFSSSLNNYLDEYHLVKRVYWKVKKIRFWWKKRGGMCVLSRLKPKITRNDTSSSMRRGASLNQLPGISNILIRSMQPDRHCAPMLLRSGCTGNIFLSSRSTGSKSRSMSFQDLCSGSNYLLDRSKSSLPIQFPKHVLTGPLIMRSQ